MVVVSFLLFFAILLYATYYAPDDMFVEKPIRKSFEMPPPVKVEVVELPMFSKN